MISVRDAWHHGCRCSAFDWIDGENICLLIEEFEPGGALSSPRRSTAYLIPKKYERDIEERFDSIICSLVWHPTKMLAANPDMQRGVDQRTLHRPPFVLKKKKK